MKSGYEKLFQEIARTNEVLAERVMEFNHEKTDIKGEETAKIMRQDYSNLYDQIVREDFEIEQLTRNDWAKLLVGTMIAVQNIEDRIKNEQKAVEGYKLDIIPKNLQYFTFFCHIANVEINIAKIDNILNTPL